MSKCKVKANTKKVVRLPCADHDLIAQVIEQVRIDHKKLGVKQKQSLKHHGYHLDTSFYTFETPHLVSDCLHAFHWNLDKQLLPRSEGSERDLCWSCMPRADVIIATESGVKEGY